MCRTCTLIQIYVQHALYCVKEIENQMAHAALLSIKLRHLILFLPYVHENSEIVLESNEIIQRKNLG